MDDNDNLVEYYKNNKYRKLNNTDEKSNEETINKYRLTKAELEKQLPYLLSNFLLYRKILKNNQIDTVKARAVPPLFLPETFNFILVVAVPPQFQKQIFNLYR